MIFFTSTSRIWGRSSWVQVLEIEKQKLNDEVSRLMKDLVFQKLVTFLGFLVDQLPGFRWIFVLLKVDELMVRYTFFFFPEMLLYCVVYIYV